MFLTYNSININKNMKSLYLLFITLFVSVVSCRTKDGAPGPAGENELTQQGSITATISFTDESGANVVKTAKYEYFAMNIRCH
jgi:hypothetical protein